MANKRDSETLYRLTVEAARYFGVVPTHADAVRAGQRMFRTLDQCKHWRDERAARKRNREM